MSNEIRMSKTTDLSLADRFLKPVLELMVSLLSAFAGSSLVGVVIFFVAFMLILMSGGMEGHYPINLHEIPTLFIAAAFFTLAYGILAPMFSLFQIAIFGIPAALIGWKVKLIRWWICMVVGFFLSSFPWSLFGLLLVIVESLTGYPPHLNEILFGMGAFIVIGFCGSIGGLCFWFTLRLLHFPDINQANRLHGAVQNNAS